MSEQTVRTRLGDLHVWRVGSGPAVLMWHSLYVDGRSMLPVAEALGTDHEVIVVDGPGHGKSPPVGRRYTIDECALAAIDLLDALGLSSVDWVGNAWGGHVGVALSRRAPDRVRSLVAMCAPLHPVEGKDRLRGWLLLAVYGLFGPVERVARPLRAALVLPGNAVAVRYVREVFKGQDRRGMVEGMRSCMLGRTSLEGPIPVPALLVTTEENTLQSVERVRAQAQVAGASVATVEGARHLPPIEAPDRVVALLRQWLAERARAASP